MACPHCQSMTTTERSKKTQLGYRTFCCHACTRTFNERTGTPFNYLEFPTDIVLLVVLWRVRYKLSLRDLAEMWSAASSSPTRPYASGRPASLPSSRSGTCQAEGPGWTLVAYR